MTRNSFFYRRKKIKVLTQQINEQKEKILILTDCPNIQSFNGKFAGKYSEYIDLKNEVIDTPEQFASLYFKGLHEKLKSLGNSAKPGNYHYDLFIKIKVRKKLMKKHWQTLKKK